MEIAFLLPPARNVDRTEFCPLGVGIITSRLLAASHRVRILDAGALGQAEFWRAARGVSADFVGIGGTIFQLSGMKTAATIVRWRNPRAWIFFAGPGAVAADRESLLRYADAILLGEGEDAVPKLLEVGVTAPPDDFPPGWTWKDGQGEIHSTGFAPKVDVASLPSPAWDAYALERYLERSIALRGRPIMHLMASRGCLHYCAFCDRRLGGSGVRQRPLDHVIQEVTDLAERFSSIGLREFYFFDPSFMNSRDWTLRFCADMSDLGRFTWGCQTRVDEVDAELLAAAYEAGCRYINFGVEAGTDRLLQALNKGTTVEQTREAFRLCHQQGIRPGAFVMVGLPEETREDTLALKRLLKNLRPKFLSVAITVPYPGTLLAKRHLYRTLPVSPEEFGEYFPDRTLFTGLDVDPLHTYHELTAFYREHVDPEGHVHSLCPDAKE